MIYKASEVTAVRHFLQRAIESDSEEILDLLEVNDSRRRANVDFGVRNRLDRIIAYEAALRALPRLRDDLRI